MYIEPQTTLKILKNVPLDEGYKNTIYFANVSAQIAYFAGKVKHTIAGSTYQRINKGVVRVPVNAEGLYDCNYIMFQNASFGTKWFYAFVTKVEYHNAEMSLVHFEIDVMQTWFFDYEMKESFVEREHVKYDHIGANLVPDDLETGNIIYNGAECYFNSEESYAEPLIVRAFASEAGLSEGTGMRGNLYSPLIYSKYEINNTGGLEDTLATSVANGNADNTVSIFMIYSQMWSEPDSPIVGDTKVIDINKTVDGYTPRNNKLFTYPYNYLTVSNSLGETIDFKWELFDDVQAKFQIFSDISCNPEVTLMPRNYRNLTHGIWNDANVTEKITLKGFPQCPFVIDTYRAWLAQNANSLETTLMTSAMSAIGGYATGNPLLMVGGSTGIKSTLASIKDKSHLPTISKGGSGANVMFSSGMLDFYFYKMSVTEQFAKIIDDYWDRFGYPCNELKVPDLTTRPNWNYIKTKDCTIVGAMPSDDIKKVCEIYDSGVTFWKNGDNVGNYSLNNKPV